MAVMNKCIEYQEYFVDQKIEANKYWVINKSVIFFYVREIR